ncbi:acyl-CoA synthetase (AMP-forming)/AMP-acid ligase II [Bradyrhizobium sp. AZCC 1678]
MLALPEHWHEKANYKSKREEEDEQSALRVSGGMRTAVAGAGEYWKRPDATAETLRSGWLHTGDIARSDERGYMFILDRKRDMIVSGGFNIFPREVEDVLSQHADVATVAVVGVPEDKWGEAVTAVIVAREGARVGTASCPGRGAARSAAPQSRDLQWRRVACWIPDQQRTTPLSRLIAPHPGHESYFDAKNSGHIARHAGNRLPQPFGWVSMHCAPGAGCTHGCALRIKKCAAGISHDVSSSVPARRLTVSGRPSRSP